MDIAALTAFLAPFLPGLIKPVQDFATEAAEKFGAAAVEQARALWERLSGKVDDKPSAREAAEDLADDPDNAGARAALQWQLEKILAADPEFARRLAEDWAAAQRSADVSVVVTASGERAVAIGRDSHGSISTGDGKPAP